MAVDKKAIATNTRLLTRSPSENSDYGVMMSLRNRLHNPDIMQAFEMDLVQRQWTRLQQHSACCDREALTQAIPIIEAGDMDAATYKKRLTTSNGVPFLLRGFLKNTKAVQQWDLPYLAQHHPHETVFYKQTTADTCEDNRQGTLADVIQQMDKAESVIYIHNTSQIFKNNPSLLQDFDYARLKHYHYPLAANALLHLFLGKSRTGTPLHAANATTAFLMLHGTKRWTFIDPRFSHALAATLNRSALNAATPITDHVHGCDAQGKAYPLYPYLPTYTVDVEAGDMLVFFPWWWHAIDNTSPASIAIASRWTALRHNTLPDGNPAFTRIQTANPHFQQYSKKAANAFMAHTLLGDEDFERDQLTAYPNNIIKGTDTR